MGSLIVIMIILGLVIYILTLGKEAFLGFDIWPFNKPDAGSLDPGIGYLHGYVKYNGGNLPFLHYATVEVGGQKVTVNNYEFGLFPEQYWINLPVGTYSMVATLYTYYGTTVATMNYSSIVIVSQQDTLREINFGGNS